MKRRPRRKSSFSIRRNRRKILADGKVGLVLSGGGVRAAYQVGALKALSHYFSETDHCPSIIVGSSIGAINGLVLGAGLKESFTTSVNLLEDLWLKRNYKNTFKGSSTAAFFRAIKFLILQYLEPGPNPTDDSLFDPTPLEREVNSILAKFGGLSPKTRSNKLETIAIMTTMEGKHRKPLLFVSSEEKLDDFATKGASFEVAYEDELKAKHGFASAALPSVLPPVELDTAHGNVKLVDGGISQNVPVDPAVRLGAEKVILIDVSGRDYWMNHYNQPLYSRPSWEVAAGLDTFCVRPPDSFVVRCQQPLGEILKEAVGDSTVKFISAVGAAWPIYKYLKNKLGEDVAYEVLSYVALDKDYIKGLINRGYIETYNLLRNHVEPEFEHLENYEDWFEEMIG